MDEFYTVDVWAGDPFDVKGRWTFMNVSEKCANETKASMECGSSESICIKGENMVGIFALSKVTAITYIKN